MIASGIEPSAIAGRIRCLIVSQNASKFPASSASRRKKFVGWSIVIRTLIRPDGGQYPELHREDVLEDDPEHEDRDRDPEERGDEAELVQEAAVALRG